MASSMQAFFMLLPSLPLIAVYLVGVIFSAAKTGQYRRAASLGTVGFGCLLVGQLIHAGSNLMTLPAYRGSLSMADLGSRLAGMNVVATMVILAGTIVLMLAIFSDREKKPGIG